MIGVFTTIFDLVAAYLAISIGSIIVFLVLGSSARDIPEEVFMLGFLWPVSLPVFLLEWSWYWLKGGVHD